MSITFEIILIVVAVLILLSVIVSKISERFGVPLLLLFLALGMLAGSEGFGGIHFDDPYLTQNISIIALTIILFSGGLDTPWKSVKSVMKEGISLATFGVILTAAVFGLFTYFILKLSLMESMLVGAIISSTDAAAVFAILRSRGINLKGRLSPLLELESGSNDPMAVLLTITLISFITNKSDSILAAVGLLLLQLVIGVIVGWIMSKISLFLINKIKLGYEGLYQILIIGLLFLTFGAATLLKGSGFLSVYLLGVLLGKEDFLHKRSVLRFFDSTAWFSQIILFLTLGLLVFPSRLLPVMLPGLGLAMILIFLARPTAIFISLAPFHFSIREKLFISWVGLRGAVPIVLATYPLVAGIVHADLIFNIVFFVVVISVLLQGTLLPWIAKKLDLESREPPKKKMPLEIVAGEMIPSELKEIEITTPSKVDGKTIVELNLPPGYLIVLISRAGAYIQPTGNTVLRSGDRLLALTEKDALDQALGILCDNCE
ncbi:MAG: potassium/proton antiporter [Chloroflexi bacterium HGW-Chloroflexi-4]|jgi:cell volume regulation protein A|nr:MAG: potassium/proton antiporter [Chloroflexi bacterium HGW-Chloroflexi-4]